MDATPESFAYRCLPLNIANSHGWELLSPCGFEAEWNGGPAVEDVVVRTDPGTTDGHAPVALFGQGVLTFHLEGLFRTPPGFSLWGRRTAECLQGRHRAVGRHHRDRLVALQLHHELALHPAGTADPVRGERAVLLPLPGGARSGRKREAADCALGGKRLDLKRQFEAWSRSRDHFRRPMSPPPIRRRPRLKPGRRPTTAV